MSTPLNRYRLSHTFPGMDQERNETYERIPWETLEKPRGDRQWIMLAVAGAVAVGALAYSFVTSRPPPPVFSEPAPAAAEHQAGAEHSPGTVAAPAPAAPATFPKATSPVVVAEADLFAVDPARLVESVVAHAEWFAVEYFSVDGSEESRHVLTSLLPSGIPLPEASPETQVFVDWVGAQAVVEVSPLRYQVEVVVRSLSAQGEEGFVRQPARVATVTVAIGDDGAPRVTKPPEVAPAQPGTPLAMHLVEVPSELAEQVEQSMGPVLGGEQLPDGRWQVVVMSAGPDGVTRPVTVTVP